MDALFNLGMCISYDRLLNLTSNIANTICEQFRADGIVCPPKLRCGIHTSAAVDNIDYNPTSSTAKDSFHGTAISLIQHLSSESEGLDRGVQITSTTSRSIVPLPSHYTNVPPACIKTKEFTVPTGGDHARPDTLMNVERAKGEEIEWLNHVMEALDKEKLDDKEWVSWSAHYAGIQRNVIPPAAINALLPLWTDSAHSVAMIKHSMNIVQAAIQHVLTLARFLFLLPINHCLLWRNKLA